MIYLTGDTHGNWKERLTAENFPQQSQMTKDDFVIVLGDFGIWDDSQREHEQLDWLDQRNFTTLFLSGNHSNYDILDSLPKKQWHGGTVNFLRPGVIHLCRGEIFDIDGLKLFAFGGAASHDIKDGILDRDDPQFDEKYVRLRMNPFSMFRINHLSWWEREMPSQEEYDRGRASLQKENWRVDGILSHCGPTSLQMEIDQNRHIYQTDLLTDYLEEILENTEFSFWACGHYHKNLQINKRQYVLYNQLLEIQVQKG